MTSEIPIFQHSFLRSFKRCQMSKPENLECESSSWIRKGLHSSQLLGVLKFTESQSGSPPIATWFHCYAVGSSGIVGRFRSHGRSPSPMTWIMRVLPHDSGNLYFDFSIHCFTTTRQSFGLSFSGAPQGLHAVSAGRLLLRKGPQVEARRAERRAVDEAGRTDIARICFEYMNHLGSSINGVSPKYLVDYGKSC